MRHKTMDTNFKTKISDDFGLGKLKPEDQEKMIERIGNMLFEAVVERSIDEMTEETLENFENFMGSVGKDYDKVIAFLSQHVPGFQTIVSDEMARLKRATAGLFA